MISVLSSLLSSSPSSSWSWSWALVVCVVCLAAVGLAVAVVTIGDEGFVGRLSLMLRKSLSRASHFKPSRAGVRYKLMSSSHLLAGLPCFRLQFSVGVISLGSIWRCVLSSGRRSVWKPFLLALNTSCSSSVDPRRDPLCANKSSALWVAHTM